jgi:putative salt-induced outer membrane protein YdiY
VAAENPVLLQKLELPDGEVLIGSLVSQDDTAYVFFSESLGEVRVKKEGAHLGPAAPAGAEIAEHPPAWAQARSAPSAPVAAKTPVAAKAVPAAPSPVKWKRAFEAGYSYQANGNQVSVTSTYVRTEIVRESPASSIGVMGRFVFGEQNSQRNADKLDTDLKFNFDYANRIVLRNDFSYSYDRLQELRNEFEENAGVNLILFKRPHFRYSVGPGVALQYAETTGNTSGYKVLGDVSQEFSWQISDRVTLNNTASYLYQPGVWADYRLRANSALIGKISDHATLNLRYEYEFEAVRPVANGRSDNRVFTTLGYTF